MASTSVICVPESRISTHGVFYKMVIGHITTIRTNFLLHKDLITHHPGACLLERMVQQPSTLDYVEIVLMIPFDSQHVITTTSGLS